MDEFVEKQARIQSLLGERKLDALLLRRVSSFAWATGGAASYVNTAAAEGPSSLLITPAGRYVITNRIEAPRLEQEEKLAMQGWELLAAPWYATDNTIASRTHGLVLGADVPFAGATNLAGEIARLRSRLTPEEVRRARVLGRLAAEAMNAAIRQVQPGQTEYEIAARLGAEAQSRGVQPIVNLVATDARIYGFRHPLPTDRKLDRYAMLVLGGRKWGLVASITRLVYFGRLPGEIRRMAEATARVDATLIDATRPGRTLGEIFRQGMHAYAAAGVPDEWQLHHQGGAAGYESREYLGTPDSQDMVFAGQVYAWNPSITGTKSEDTVLVGETANEVLTATDGWPMLPVTTGSGQMIERPAILEIA